MDPLSHAVLGRAVIGALGGPDVSAREPRGRGVGAAAILGALSPDIDFVMMPAGWDIYLRAHAAGTHSLAGAIVTGLGSAVLIRVCARNSALPHLSRAAVIGAMTHLVGDIVSGARLQLAWPLMDHPLSLPLVAMGDPWTIGILVVGAWAMWRQRQRLTRAARLTVLALTLLLMFKAAMLATILPKAGLPSAGTGSDRMVEARWASLTDWFVYDRVAGQLRQRLITRRSAEPRLLLAIDVPAGTALTRQSQSLQAVRNFLAVHELAFPVERMESNGRRSVLWSDIRFCWREDERGTAGSALRPTLRRSRAPVQAPSCALWFGGVFNAEGRPIGQEVHVGSWIQRRAP
jgi:membrane-bound metal-dependent hydrolase YbcI (DUF457 family)